MPALCCPPEGQHLSRCYLGLWVLFMMLGCFLWGWKFGGGGERPNTGNFLF